MGYNNIYPNILICAYYMYLMNEMQYTTRKKERKKKLKAEELKQYYYIIFQTIIF